MTVASSGRIVLTRFGTESRSDLFFTIQRLCHEAMPFAPAATSRNRLSSFCTKKWFITSPHSWSRVIRVKSRCAIVETLHSATHPSRHARKIRFYVYFRINASWRSNIFLVIRNYARLASEKEETSVILFEQSILRLLNIFYQRAYNTPNHVKNLIHLKAVLAENLIRVIFTRSAQTEQMSP